jgi:hypothetical protein
MKRIAAFKGIPVRSDVRAPLRDLAPDESLELAQWLGQAAASS